MIYLAGVAIFVGWLLAVVVKAWMPSWELEGLQPVIVALGFYGVASVVGVVLWLIYRFLVDANDRKQWWQELGIVAVALVAPLPVWEGVEWVGPHIGNLWDALGNI